MIQLGGRPQGELARCHGEPLTFSKPSRRVSCGFMSRKPSIISVTAVAGSLMSALLATPPSLLSSAMLSLHTTVGRRSEQTKAHQSLALGVATGSPARFGEGEHSDKIAGPRARTDAKRWHCFDKSVF